jgi:hypothetical protein
MPLRALGGAAAWRGEELARSTVWLHEWSPAELADLERALQHARAVGRPIARLTAADFPLTSAAATLASVREQVLRGRGFALLRGLDPGCCSRADLATIFWGIGAHFGRAVPQNARGHLLGHVIDLGLDAGDPSVRLYQTNQRQGYHTDSADIVALLCLQTALVGGRSSLVSCATLHDAMWTRCPGLLGVLFEPVCTDHRGEHPPGSTPWFEAPVLSWHREELTVLYQRRYIESAQRFDGVPKLSVAQRAALDAFDALCDDPRLHLEMDLQPGDIQLVDNHRLLHDRTAFRDSQEPGRKRHLLRLWLCPPDGRPLPPSFAARYGSVEPGRRGGVVLPGVEPNVPLEP